MLLHVAPSSHWRYLSIDISLFVRKEAHETLYHQTAGKLNTYLDLRSPIGSHRPKMQLER
jgi:hypothetical protein